MTEVRDSLRESHVATPEAVGAIRHAVAEFASATGISGERLDGLRLAVSEAVTNVVRHAYPTGPGQVHVTAHAVNSDEFTLVERAEGGTEARMLFLIPMERQELKFADQ